MLSDREGRNGGEEDRMAGSVQRQAVKRAELRTARKINLGGVEATVRMDEGIILIVNQMCDQVKQYAEHLGATVQVAPAGIVYAG